MKHEVRRAVGWEKVGLGVAAGRGAGQQAGAVLSGEASSAEAAGLPPGQK
ncbi:hypothetical protein KNP414_05517 [Paenibacillus mucilaginosus KNP414]|uniref:Uncharacterized protein n=1 Tax=Paenibacillus mucilaginosus (strain KNP414) TaxID=1036673 RepID=F8FK00_PAEMK|nr:hypothetical protein KNP414_05517 [Paenibacillus mucilaginosus KNP414]